MGKSGSLSPVASILKNRRMSKISPNDYYKDGDNKDLDGFDI